jgi:hypothetical protein
MLYGLLAFVGIVAWLWAIFDAATSDRARVRLLPKIAWIVLIVVLVELTPLGAIAWVVLGRPRGAKTRQPSSLRSGWGGPSSAPRGSRPAQGKSRPIGPDDDPDFLSGLNRR